VRPCWWPPHPGTDSESFIPCEVFSVSTWTYNATPGIHITTYWVQFLDGSTWGSAGAQAYMMAQRTNAIAFLHQLQAAYTAGGAQAFTQALAGFNPMGPTSLATAELSEAHNTQLLLQDMQDVPTHLAEVNRQLAVAASRANWMK
jgi:hypothetical protein